MWQTIIVLLILAGVLIYIVRHYADMLRGETSGCSSCALDCPARQGLHVEPDPCGCRPEAKIMEQEGR